jgi:hypothetical protein
MILWEERRVRVFEIRVLTRKFDPGRDEVTMVKEKIKVTL